MLIDKKHQSSIRSYRGVDCNSDHPWIKIKLSQRLKQIHKTRDQVEGRRHEDRNFKNTEVKIEFQL